MIAGTECAHSTFVAIVHGHDGVSFTAIAPTRTTLRTMLGDYVRRQARHQLWAVGSDLVLRLLESGKTEAAIETYFSLVGSRWDEEWLVTARVPATSDPANDVAASVGAVIDGLDKERTASGQPTPFPVEAESHVIIQPLKQRA